MHGSSESLCFLCFSKKASISRMFNLGFAYSFISYGLPDATSSRLIARDPWVTVLFIRFFENCTSYRAPPTCAL